MRMFIRETGDQNVRLRGRGSFTCFVIMLFAAQMLLSCTTESTDSDPSDSADTWVEASDTAPPPDEASVTIGDDTSTDTVADTECKVTWQDVAVVASGADLGLAFNNTPLANRHDDRVIVLYTDKTNVLWARKQAADPWQFGALERLLAAAKTGPKKPTIARGADASLIVAWLEGDTPNKNQVAVSRSTDDGLTYQAPFAISDTDAHAVNPALHVFAPTSSATSAALIWENAALVANEVVVSVWSNSDTWAAAGWSAPKALSNSEREARDATITGQGALLYAAWEASQPGSKKNSLYMSTSTDSGATWTAPSAVIGGSAELGGDPSLALTSEGHLYLAYQAKMGVHLLRSTDGGVSFEDLAKLGDGLFAHAATADGTTAVAWEHFKGNSKRNEIKSVGLTVSIDGWDQTVGPHAMPGSDAVLGCSYGGVIVGSGRIDAFWMRDTATDRHLEHRAASVTCTAP